MPYDRVFLTLGICILASVPLCLCMKIDPTSAIAAEEEEDVSAKGSDAFSESTLGFGDTSTATDLSSPLIG